ncbi:thiopurine S-methyltransferase [Ixodes scapularis]|uniref:thiopurine S-methyltransferase n=1 Tax=Ixodes scapularis TaxID=6945 RepID=UPI001A9CFB48|nr:thiopurine S-methyltransferase [Ixodes scapularis]
MMGTEGKSDMPQFEYWTNRWNNGDTSWQLDGVNPLLEKNQDVILAGKQDARVFIPMCGKAHELKWFYNKGHRVVGVEFIETVARSYFLDNCLPLDEGECPILKCKIFQTPDKRLRIFVCSVFDFDKSCAGAMDIVWDRGGLCSIDVELRDRYITLMMSLLSPNFSYALWTIVYDNSYKGFPTSMPEAVLRELFAGRGINLRFIDSDCPSPLPYATSATIHLWHLTE